MMKMNTVFKKVLKTFIWMVVITAFLFLIVAELIQIPSIQTRIVKYATSFISTKTHTKVEISAVSISFPKSVVLKGIYLEDLNRDTLIYAGNATLNVALYDLFQNQIAISSFGLEDATVKLYSTLTDPRFNYDFLITAFSDTSTQQKTDTISASKWKFSLDEVTLKNIRFTYRDEYTGMDVFALLENSAFRVDEISPKKSVYQFDELLLDGLTAIVRMKESGNTLISNPENISPRVGAKNLQLNNSTVSYTDSVGNLSVDLVIDECEIEDASVDLEKQLLTSASLELSESQIRYHDLTPEIPLDSVRLPSKNKWQVSVNQIGMKENFLIYKVGNKPEIKGIFNPDYWEYSQLNLDASEFQYSSDSLKVVIKEFNATDKNKFAINSLETKFRMDEHSITTNKLKLSTDNSTLDADFNIQFSSMRTLIDSLEFEKLNLVLRNLQFKNSDLLYFNPELIAQPFFKNNATVTTASGEVNGSLDNMSAKNLVVKTGENTILKTDFIIKGLPEYETAFYDFPNLSFISGKKDLQMMAGSYLPDSIGIPEKINMLIAFKGSMKSFETKANLISSLGDANLIASIDPDEKFSGSLKIDSLDLGRILKDTLMYGPVSLTAEINGQGLSKRTVEARIKAEVSQIFLNDYTYHKLVLEGNVAKQEFDGQISLKDKNLEFSFDGQINLNPNKEHYQFRLNVAGADLQKLHFSNEDLRIGLTATVDFKGGFINELNGKAGFSNILIAKDGKIYPLEPVILTSVNQPGKCELTLKSELIDLNYSGTVFPLDLPHELNRFISTYFRFSDSSPLPRNNEPSDFKFEVQLHNRPILSEVILPNLKEFEPGIIEGSFDSQKNDLKINASIKKLVYGTTEIKDFTAEVNSDSKAVNYKFSLGGISNSQINIDNFTFDGRLADNIILADISSTDGKNKKLQIQSQLVKANGNFRLTLDPKEFYLVNKQWDIAADNSIEFGKLGFKIHHFFLNHKESQIQIASVNNRFNDDLNITFNNFELDDLSRIIEKDTSLVKGIVNGNVLLKRVNNAYGIVADAKISNLIVKEIPIGNLNLKAERSDARKFDLDVNLSGPDNNLTAKGYLVPNGKANTINIRTEIQSLSMKTVEAFSMGQISEADGTLTGNFLIEGTTDAPDLSGELTFNDAYLKPSFLNNRLEIKNETVRLKKDGIYFDSFTMHDATQHTAIIDGSVLMKQFSDFVFALQVNTKDFLLFNTTSKNNKEFFGRMVIDSKIDVKGPMSLPVVNAKVKMKEGSNFTFSVPEDKLTTDKGEGVVEFDNSQKFNLILYRDEKKTGQTTGISGFDLASIIEIDKEATLRLLMDPASTDSLVVKGEAALSFTMDQSGKMSLTGAYNLNEGSYLVSLESVIKKKFDIDDGSTIIWNGDPLGAEISIDAKHSVRASPYDLVADQISGLSDVDKGGYKQRYPFLVLLKLRGEILHPVISFEIQLSPEDKGILGGAVNQKLNMLNEDESALNKQVFALLVLGRFIQENPFQTEYTGTSTIIRSTVGKFLSAQLNQLSSQVIPGMELNFDIQSYDDYQSGQAKGRTQVEIGVKKQLFNERLSVQLGGTVDVEGDEVKQNSANDITSDITIEYKFKKDGRFRMKGFRHNQYEGAIEGQLIETGIGVVYVRDFNRWSRLFKSQNYRRDSTNTRNNDVPVKNK